MLSLPHKSLPSAFWSYTCIYVYVYIFTAYMCVFIFLIKDTVICCLSLYNPLLFLFYWFLLPYIEFFWLPPPSPFVCMCMHACTCVGQRRMCVCSAPSFNILFPWDRIPYWAWSLVDGQQAPVSLLFLPLTGVTSVYVDRPSFLCRYKNL